MKRLLVFLALTAVLGVQIGAQANHGNNQRAHWGRRTARLIDSVEGRWNTPLTDASQSWNSGLTRVTTAVIAGGEDLSTRERCPYGKVAVRVCNADYPLSPGVIGLAQYRYSLPSRHITRARILLDDSTAVGSEFVVTLHEIGHTLGLNHDNDVTSCMTPSVNPLILGPNQHDYNMVKYLHGHRHSAGAKAKTSSSQASAFGDHGDPDVRMKRSGNTMSVTWILRGS
jgi:hypothetical protein